jgi:hypothetical protein
MDMVRVVKKSCFEMSTKNDLALWSIFEYISDVRLNKECVLIRVCVCEKIHKISLM